MTNQIAQETQAILARVNEIDAALDADLTIAERLTLQDELMALRMQIERLRHHVLGVPLAAICDVDEDEE